MDEAALFRAYRSVSPEEPQPLPTQPKKKPILCVECRTVFVPEGKPSRRCYFCEKEVRE